MMIRRSEGRRALPPLRGKALCLGGDPRESDAGAQVFEAGGNAVDAAVAAAFVACVVEQVDASLGGFVHLSLLPPRSAGGFVAYDGFVCAPRRATPTMFEPADVSETYYGHPTTRGDTARWGPRAVAVPGAVAGLLAAHAEHGRLSRAQVLEPAIALARAGVPFGWRDALTIGQLLPEVRAQPAAAAALLPAGRIPATPLQRPDGDVLDTSALARTLEAIAERGAPGFYRGPVAEALVRATGEQGGALQLDDLADYRARVFAERAASYRGRQIATCDDGIALEALALLEGFDLSLQDPRGAERAHLLAEALGRAFVDNLTFASDPRFGVTPAAALRSAEYVAQRRRDIDPRRAAPRPIAPGDPWPFHRGVAAPTPAGQGDFGGTTQIVAADEQGCVVSIITAVGWSYGSLVYAPEAGVFLNNGMSYFDPRPGRRASIAPGKRPLFGAPALTARDGEGRALCGCAGSGGYRIGSAVVQALLHLLDDGMAIDAAVEGPRVHCQGDETFVDARYGAEVLGALEAAGHRLAVCHEDASTWSFARLCLLAREPDGSWSGSASPHWLVGAAAL